MSARQALHLALIATAGSVYLGLGYFTAASAHPPLAAIFLGIAPLGAVALVAAWHSRLRIPSLILCTACAIAVVLNLDNLRNHAAWLYFVQHAGAMTLLGATFGSTLASGHAGALCSRIASLAHAAPLDAVYLHYTWKVTCAWTAFFILSAVVSVLLFFFGPVEAWSFFANLLTPVLLGAMFVGEYLIRQRALPDRAHFSIAATIHAYREYSRRQNLS